MKSTYLPVLAPLSTATWAHRSAVCVGCKRTGRGHTFAGERARELDGGGYVDLRAASAIYFIETRARVQDVVVLMNLQLYMVDSINYLVDFHHKKTYKASIEPGAGRLDMAHLDYNLSEPASESSRSIKDFSMREEEVVSPFIFMDVACRLILELAGGGE